MEKLNLHSPDFTQANMAKLADLFPNCVTESRESDGSLKKAIDFDLLKQELSSSIVEGPQERYQLNWPGKREALLTANSPIAKTLRSCRDESVDFDTTQNLYIEGDNLDALKLLQETYLGKVKMIYIDPPYNTGNDFIYKDDFAENSEAYFERSNQKDEVGNRLVANNESNGRFHSDWLSMMYSRLKLARNLLKDDGVIFISIDDNEQANLKRLCDEIFGEDNFVANVVWHLSSGTQAGHFTRANELIFVFAKSKINLPYFNAKTGGSIVHGALKKISTANPASEILFKKGSISCETENIEFEKEIGGSEKQYITNGVLKFVNGKIAKERGTCHPKTVISSSEVGNTKTGGDEISSLFGEKIMSFPKPTGLIKFFSNLVSEENDIILDFFSGSATTAHAVMQLNAEDGGKRKFIMVQLPEACDPKSEAYKAGYQTIAEIGKERIRRAGHKIKADNAEKSLDIGFRVLKVDSSNMKDVYYTPDNLNQNDLFNLVDNIREGRSAEDLLFQVLLDWGVDLTLPITEETIIGFKVLFVDENALAACFDTDINETFIKVLAARHPLRVVFRDTSFANDSVKINIEQIFKLISPYTEIKVI